MFLARCKGTTQEDAIQALGFLSVVGAHTPRLCGHGFSDISYQDMIRAGYGHEDALVMSVNGRGISEKNDKRGSDR